MPADGPIRRAPGKKKTKKSDLHPSSTERPAQALDQGTEPSGNGEIMDLDTTTDLNQDWGVNDEDDNIDEEDEESAVTDSQSQLHELTGSDAASSRRVDGRSLHSAGRSRATSTLSDLTRAAITNAAHSLTPEPHQPHGRNAKAYAHGERDIDKQIENLKRSLKKFQLVYGDNLPEPDYGKYDIDHVWSAARVPRAIPKSGFRTQGHKHLQYAVVPKGSTALTNHMLQLQAHNRVEGQANDGLQHNQTRTHDAQVLTEDPYFGMFPFDRSEIYSPEEQEMLRVQSTRMELRDANLKDAEAVRQFHTEIAEEKELEKQLVLQQLKQKVFSWETKWTIAGVLTDENGLPNGNFHRVREDNEKWKRLAERQAILDAGGEAADKIWLEEREAVFEEEGREKRREDRRRQSAMQRAKAAGLAGEETRLSGWVAEE